MIRRRSVSRSPKLQVDLSAIAKGYGVDQVVELLNDAGASNVFVEIGGEVRTSGNKAGQWWKVGIQVPDAVQDSVMIAHAMSTGAGNDQSMATSGDYRNFFEVGGHPLFAHHRSSNAPADQPSPWLRFRWSPKAAWRRMPGQRPSTCSGPTRVSSWPGVKGLDALLISRSDEGFVLAGTGTLAQYASRLDDDAGSWRRCIQDAVDDHNSLAVLMISAFGVCRGFVRDGGRRDVWTPIDQRLLRRLGQLAKRGRQRQLLALQ